MMVRWTLQLSRSRILTIDTAASLSCAPAARPWQQTAPPRRLLAIRMQAFGDVVITLPYLRALQEALPGSVIDLVTRREDAALPRAVRLFRHVEGIGGGRSERRQLLLAPIVLPRLAARRYDVVLDLQNNRVSRTIRRALRPRAWASFDRFSPISAGERTRETIARAGFPLDRIEAGLPLVHPDIGDAVLRDAGYDPSRELIVLSPAGAFPTRNWPIDSYVRFVERWPAERRTQFAVLGLASLADKAAILARALAGRLLNLAGRTSPVEAAAIVQRAALVVAEDCGLMHVAWVSGVPTLALFGSSRHVWAAPLGDHTVCLHSGDLECGACMEPACRYGDVHCLTRWTAEEVIGRALSLLARTSARSTAVPWIGPVPPSVGPRD
jgi:heptosyltransferase II